jgi:hypothetical protein
VQAAYPEDEVLFEYIEARDRAQSPASLQPIRDRGLCFAGSCRRGCAGAQRIFRTDSELSRGAWICSACSAPWPISRGVILVGEVQEGRAGGRERLLGEVAEMGRALSALDHWEQRIYLELYLWRGLSYEATARAANDRWARRTRQWTVWRVRQVVARARAKLRMILIIPSRPRIPSR